MKKSGFTLVEIMIVVAIIALLAAIAVPGLLRARMNANTSSAKATIQSIVTAVESYAAANGVYPGSNYTTQLADVTPPYIAAINTAPTGYAIGLGTPATTGYSFTVRPNVCNTTGSKSWTASTGGVITEDTSCTNA